MRIYQPTPIGAVVKQDTYNVEAGDTVIKSRIHGERAVRLFDSDNAQKWIIPVLGKAVDNVTLQFQILASNGAANASGRSRSIRKEAKPYRLRLRRPALRN